MEAKYEGQKIPGELYLALLGLAGISDEIQQDVVVNGPIGELLLPPRTDVEKETHERDNFGDKEEGA